MFCSQLGRSRAIVAAEQRPVVKLQAQRQWNAMTPQCRTLFSPAKCTRSITLHLIRSRRLKVRTNIDSIHMVAEL